MEPKQENIIIAELQRIRHHQELQKKVNDDNSFMLNDIKNTLIGSNFNDNKGIIKQLDKIDGRVQTLEVFENELKIYVRVSKFLIGTIFVALVGLIISFINK